LYAHWWYKFWKSGWNIFDVVVVSIGIINTIQLPLPPSFSVLRMMRAFKVLKLFNRVPSLNKIIVTIFRAIPGVANAFLILAIVMSIYAILAVEFYFEIGNDCNSPGGDTRFRTARGLCAGNEYFGTFTKSLYTFFQVLTGESWSEAVARPAIWFFYKDPLKAVAGGLFFVSYILVSAFVLINVVVAVLLDKMVDPEIAQAAHEMHPDHPANSDAPEGEEGETAETSNGTDTLVKKEKEPLPTAGDLQSLMESVTNQVVTMMSDSDNMSSEMNSFKADLGTMQMEMSSIMQKCLK